MAYSSINHDLDDWKWKVIFETNIVKVLKIHVNTGLTIPLFFFIEMIFNLMNEAQLNNFIDFDLNI
jgi:hypothetical protein